MRPIVILRRCASYEPDRIRGIVREGIQAVGDLPQGKVLVKPNGVIAHPEYFAHAYTRAEFLDGVLGALRDVAPQMAELAVGERCGIGMPTRLTFNNAGWHPVLKKHQAKAYFFDEEPQVEVKLGRTPRLRDYFYTPEPVARCDYLVNLPKFKTHPWTTLTLALKNFIGIQQDEHRLIDHDHRLDEKIADLQEIVRQRFIAVDGIVAGEGRMLTPAPFPLGLIIMGNNPVAVDAVCCHLLGLDPKEIGHIRAAHAKGIGPIELSEISLDGDVSLEEGKAAAKGLKAGLIRVEDFFRGTRITAHAGPPPEEMHFDYCWGGCPGAIEEAIDIVRKMQPDADEKMKRFTLVFGGYKGPIEPQDGQKVVFVGDCARWEGKICGRAVRIDSTYVDRKEKDPHRAKSESIFRKMVRMFWILSRGRNEQVLRLHGCPVSVSEMTHLIAGVGRTKNPYFVPKAAVPFLRAYVVFAVVRLFKRLLGMPDRKRAVEPPPRLTA